MLKPLGSKDSCRDALYCFCITPLLLVLGLVGIGSVAVVLWWYMRGCSGRLCEIGIVEKQGLEEGGLVETCRDDFDRTCIALSSSLQSLRGMADVMVVVLWWKVREMMVVVAEMQLGKREAED